MYLELVIYSGFLLNLCVVMQTPNNTTLCECVPYYMCKHIPERRVDDNLCDYSSFCCETKHISLKIPKQHPENLIKCGRRNPNGVGFEAVNADDKIAHFGEFPWMTALLQKPKNSSEPLIYQCGASLIHPQVVLTAAHCIRNENNEFKIRVGEWDTQTEKEVYPHQEKDVKSIMVHPNYNKSSLIYDVALLILDSPVQIEEHVNVVCLPTQNSMINTLSCYSSGWGKHLFGRKDGFTVPLRKDKLSMVDNERCQKTLRNTRLGSFFKLDNSFLCAGSQPGDDRCNGDSGSFLTCSTSTQENKYFQVGIVSWGIGCEVPRVYTNVLKAIDWIDKVMTDNSFSISS